MADRPTAGAGITRRDFVQGAAVGSTAITLTGAALTGAFAAGTARAGDVQANPGAPAGLAAHADEPDGYYPPLRTGIRGSHPGSFEIAHALRDGEAVGQALSGPPVEAYDLVVVGGGISGLSAALFYRDRNPGAKILILENHDDFGGHAKRNEFRLRGHTLIMNGGTAGIESPTPYSPVADGLLRRLGIDTPRLIERYEGEKGKVYEALGMGGAVFLDKETFGRDSLHKLAKGALPGAAMTGGALSARALRQIDALETGSFDPLAPMPIAARKDYLTTISYRTYLMKHGRLGEEAIRFYQNRPLGWWCVGADGICALDAWGSGFPGYKGAQLPPGGTMKMGYTPRGFASTDGSYDFHFPDGNATIARMLVSQLVPGFAKVDLSPEESILSPVSYGALDRDGQGVRIRLSSTALRVANRATGADVVYLRNGVPGSVPVKVAARHVVMACWNMIIPYIIPDLPEPQKAALHELVKEPLVYVSVALDNWRAFAKAGISRVQFPGAYYHFGELDPVVPIGGLAPPQSPDDPVVFNLTHIPHAPGLSEHDQCRAGRAELLATDFATYEGHVVDLLTRVVGPHGFDAKRDIAAITVNRWPHGYAPEYNALWDAHRDDEALAPHLVGRQKFGAITIANSDSGRAAYTDSAIDQAFRAVNELFA